MSVEPGPVAAAPTPRRAAVHGAALVLLLGCALWPWLRLWPGFAEGPAAAGLPPPRPDHGWAVGDLITLRTGGEGLQALARLCPPEGALRVGDAVRLRLLPGGCALAGRPLGAPTRRHLGLALPINEATATELEGLPGIGPARAAALLAARPYRDARDLQRARGIGPKRAQALAPQVRFTASPSLLPTTGPPEPPPPPPAASAHRRP
jgi:hypothetical protein